MNDFKSERDALRFIESKLKGVKGCYFQKVYLKFTSGFPDLIVGYQGDVAFYELKVFKIDLEHSLKQIKPIQKATMSKMRRAGLIASGLILKDQYNAWVYEPCDNGSMVRHIPNFTAFINTNPARLY